MAEQTKKFEPQMNLILHATIPVEEKVEGEEIYRQLKEMLISFSKKVQIFGQITETLEPCCGDKKQNVLH